MPDYLQRALLGHAGQGVADDYGSPRKLLHELAAAVEAALPHLGDVPDAIFHDNELIDG